jgi:hypothetical protein
MEVEGEPMLGEIHRVLTPGVSLELLVVVAQATRHRAEPAYTLTAYQGERFAPPVRLRPDHRAADSHEQVCWTSTRATYGGIMSASSGEDDFLYELQARSRRK